MRRRTGGTDAAWHLKLPLRPGTRQELHLPLSDGPVPAEMQERVAEFTGGAPLLPIALLETARTVRRLTGPDGTVLAEVADDEVTTHNGQCSGHHTARAGGGRPHIDVDMPGAISMIILHSHISTSKIDAGTELQSESSSGPPRRCNARAALDPQPASTWRRPCHP